MKPFLLPVLLLATSLAANAQTTSPVAAPVFAPQAYTVDDSVAAVHRLFAAKRKACTLLVGGTAAGAGAAALLMLSQPAPRTSGGGFDAGIDGRPVAATFIALGSLPVIGLELLACGGWGRRAEQRAVAAVQAHQLPRYLRRTLRARYFQPRPGR